MTGNKNEAAESLIRELEKTGIEKKAPVWTAVSKMASRPRRKKIEVSVYDIEKKGRKGETLIVPGTVLSGGNIKKPVKVAALRFTPAARKKIEAAGGSCMEIKELLKSGGSGKGLKIRILG